MPGWKIRNSFPGKGVNVKKIFFIVIISIGILALLKNGLTYFSARNHRDSLKTEIEELKVKNAEAEKKISGIYNDKELVEKKAREELGMVKEGETVIKIRK
jgi:cell division protein FtsB